MKRYELDDTHDLYESSNGWLVEYDDVVKLQQKLNLYKNTLTLISQLSDVRIDEAQVIATQALENKIDEQTFKN